MLRQVLSIGRASMARRILVLALSAFASLQMSSANAAGCNWTGGPTGNFNALGNWSCNHVPTSADNVIINGAFTVTIAPGDLHTVNVVSLSSGATLAGGPNSRLEVLNGGSVVSSTLASVELIVTSGSMTVSGVTMSDIATSKPAISVDAGGNITGNITNGVAGELRFYSGGTGSFLCVSCGRMNVSVGGAVSISGNSSYAEIDNKGTIEITGGMTLTMTTPSGFDQSLSNAVVRGMGPGSTFANSADGINIVGGIFEGTLTFAPAMATPLVQNNGAKIAPGGAGIGTITINGNYSQANSASLSLELDSAVSFDQFVVSGQFILNGGSLNVSLTGGYTPLNAAAHNLISFAGHSGNFMSVVSPPGYQALVSYPSAMQLAVTTYISKTCVWKTGTAPDTNWSNPNNWNFCGGGIPGANDAAEFGGAGVINMAAGSYTVRNIYPGTSNLTGAHSSNTILNVTEAGPPSWASGVTQFTTMMINLNGSGSVYGTSGGLRLNDAVMNIGANINFDAGTSSTGNEVKVDGSLARLIVNANGSLRSVGDMELLNGGRLIIAANGYVTHERSITLSSGAKVENSGQHDWGNDVDGGALTISGTGSEYINYSGGTFEPHDDVTMSSGGKFVNGGAFYTRNQRTISGTFDNSGALYTSNAGLTIANGADFTMVGSGSSLVLGHDLTVTTGTLTLANGELVYGNNGGSMAVFASDIVNTGATILPSPAYAPGLGVQFSGTYTQGTGGTLKVVWDDMNYSSVSVIGALTLAGTLHADFQAPIPPTSSIAQFISSTVSRNGAFSTLNFTPSGQAATIAYLSNAVELTKTAPALVSVSPTSHTYPSTEYGQFADHTFTVTNNTGVASTMANTILGFTGSDVFDYKVQTDNCTGLVANGGTCTVVVRFAPGTAPISTKTADFFITINGGTATVALSGTALQRTSGGWIAFNTGSSGFSTIGNTTVGTTQGVGVTVTNVGNAAVTLTSATGTTPFAASDLGGCLSALAPGNSCGATLNFTPSAPGAANGTFTVVAPTNTIMRHAMGNGTNTLAPTVVTTVLSPTILLGGTTRATLTITNPNASTPLTGLAVSSFLTSGQLQVAPAPNATTTCGGSPEIAAFSGANNASVAGVTLAAMASCIFSYDFKASNTTGSFSVGSNFVSSNEVSSVFNGGFTSVIVASATPSVSPTTFSLGTVPQGGFADTGLITIYGGSGLTSLAIASSDANFTLVSNTCAATLAAATSCTFRVRFAPTALGADSSSVTVTHSMGTLGTIAVDGTGIAPLPTTITQTAAALNFGNVNFGSVGTAQTVTITNTGANSLFITSILLSGASVADYSINYPGCLSVPITTGNTCIITLNVTPTGTGTRAAQVDIVSNATGSPHAVTLTTNSVGPSITLAPASLNFGTLVIGTTSASQTVTLTNTSGVGITISNISFTGGGAGFNVLGSSGCITTPVVPAGMSCTFQVTATPGSAAVLNDTVYVGTSPAGVFTPTNVALSVTGQTIAAALTVTNTNDSGAGSLRDVITYRNANCTGTESITFNIAGGGPHTIQPLSPLPDMACDNTTVDGYSQSGATANTNTVNVYSATPSGNDANLKIILNGTSAGSSRGLTITGNLVTIKGLAIRSFQQEGIFITGNSARIYGNYIGTDPGGMTAYGNGFAGIKLAGGSGSWLGGFGANANLITGNGFASVQVFAPATTFRVWGNMLGGDRAGGNAVTGGGNGALEIYGAMCPTPTLMGGDVYGNRMQFNAGSGVFIDTCASNNLVSENAIAANGAKAINTNGTSNNGLQTPIISTVAYGASPGTTVTGTYSALATGTHRIDLYGNTTAPTISEAQFYAANTNNGSTSAASTGPGQPYSVNNNAIVLSPAVTLTRNGTGTSELSDLYRTPFSFTPGSGNGSVLPTVAAFNVVAGGGSQFQTVSITNTSGASITFGATPVAVTGTGFVVGTPATPCAGQTIANGGSCNVQIGFGSATITSSTGSATVSVLQNGVTTTSTVALSGTATAAPSTTITALPNPLAFGNRTVGVAATNQVFTVTNTGANPLIVSGGSITGSNGADFGLAGSTCSGSIAPAATCAITVSFTPGATGARTGQFNLTSNATGSPHAIALTGTGTAPLVSASPSSRTFGLVLVGNTTSTQSVTFTNDTAAAVTFSAGALGGANPADFSASMNNCVAASPLAIGGSCTISFAFTPGAAGARSATYTVASTATSNPTITLSGTGNAGTGPFAYITNDGTDNVSVVNITTGAVVTTIPVGDGPFGVAVNPAGTKAYVTNYTGGTLSVIDTSTNTVVATPNIGALATTVVVKPDGSSVIVGSDTAAVTQVINPASNTIASTITSGRVDGVAISPGGNRVYTASNTDNSVKVFDTASGTLLATITVPGAVSLAMSSDGRKLYAANYTGNNLSVIDTLTNTVSATITLASAQYAVTLNPAGTRLYVSRQLANAVDVIDTANNTVITTIPVADKPLGLAVDSSGANLVVARRDANKVSVFDAANNTFLREVTVGTAPHAVGQFMVPAAVTVTAPTITTLTLPAGFVGIAYSQTPVATGTGPFNWGLLAGTLPPGLTLNNVTGTLSGSPTTAGTYNYTLQAHNGTSSGTMAYTQTITATALVAAPTSLTFANTLVGANSATQSVTMTNNTGVAGGLMLSLPTHIQYVTDNCGGFAIGASCIYQFRFVPGAAGALSGTITLTANGQTASIGFTGTGVTVGVAASSTSVGFGSIAVGVTSAVQTVTLTNNTAGSITFSAGAVSGTNAADFAVNATNCTAAAVAPAGTCTISVSFTPAAAGTRSATYTVASTAMANPLITLGGTGTVSGTLPVITSPAPPAGLMGINYLHTFTASGTTPITWSIPSGSLPPGLTLAGGTGVVSGTPTQDGNFIFTIRATNTAGQANQATAINIAVPIIPAISVTPDSLDFGSQNIGTTSAARVVTVRNTGNGPFDITSISGNGDFGFSSACPSRLTAGAACTVEITFSPLTAGNLTGLINVNSNARAGSGAISLSGNGIAVPRANFVVNPGSLTFGDQAVGTNSLAQAIFISNTGLATLSLRAIDFSGADFVSTSPVPADNPRSHPACGGSLAPAASCVMGVAFAPQGTAGAKTGSISIRHNGTATGNDATSIISLGGTATARREALIRVSGGASFNDQVLGTESAPQAITVTNTGTIDLLLGGLSITGTNANTTASDFRIQSACGSIAPNASCNLSVFFRPVATAGTKEATLTIASNAVNASAGIAGLLGNALPVPVPILRVSPTAIGFPTTPYPAGGGATRTVTISNTGVLPLILTGITPSAGYTVFHDCGASLAPNVSCTVTVSFAPTSTGDFSGTLTITSQAPGGSQTVSLSGKSCLVSPVASRFIIGSSCQQ